MQPPLIGVTVNNRDNSAASGKYELAITYTREVAACGGVPVLLPHEPELAGEYVRRCDGIICTGGMDPDTTPFGEPMHPKARRVDPRRQAFELALLDVCRSLQPDKPVLGICLGMQLLTLHAGGRLDQYLPEHLPTAAMHQKENRHPVVLCAADSVLIGEGSTAQDAASRDTVVSWHQQAVCDPGSLRVVARASDGVIEAVDDPQRRFYGGVQWHPERGGDGPFNRDLIARLVRASRSATKGT